MSTRVTLVEAIDRTREELEQADKDNLSRIEYNSSKLMVFEKEINQNKAYIQDIRDSVKENTKMCVEMTVTKLDAALY